jgi:hypothetical protein
VLRTEGRVTMIDGILAVAVLLGLVLNAGLGWWWADPVTGYMLVYYAAREVPTPVMTNTPNDWNGSAWTTPPIRSRNLQHRRSQLRAVTAGHSPEQKLTPARSTRRCTSTLARGHAGEGEAVPGCLSESGPSRPKAQRSLSLSLVRDLGMTGCSVRQ